MHLIGMLDSPYVRRVAVSLALWEIPFTNDQVSVFRHFDAFRAINPVVKAPTLITDDGTVLMESSLILDHLEWGLAPDKRLMPQTPDERKRALRAIGLALAAAEKAVQIVYETNLRPEEKQHQPWLDRVTGQLRAAFDALEAMVAAAPQDGWILGQRLTQADVTAAIVWTFTQAEIPAVLTGAAYPALSALNARAEALPAFRAWPPQ
jgi:glutathione S-transferase